MVINTTHTNKATKHCPGLVSMLVNFGPKIVLNTNVYKSMLNFLTSNFLTNKYTS